MTMKYTKSLTGCVKTVSSDKNPLYALQSIPSKVTIILLALV